MTQNGKRNENAMCHVTASESIM